MGGEGAVGVGLEQAGFLAEWRCGEVKCEVQAGVSEQQRLRSKARPADSVVAATADWHWGEGAVMKGRLSAVTCVVGRSVLSSGISDKVARWVTY